MLRFGVLKYGIDEAALGPRLGPFCACLTSFRIDKDLNGELYRLLPELVCQKPDKSARLVIADSKKIFSPASGAAVLEKTVLTMVAAAGLPIPENFLDFLQMLCSASDVRQALDSPWLSSAAASKLKLPWAAKASCRGTPNHSLGLMTESGARFADELSALGVEILPPTLRFISAAAFNVAIEKFNGKGPAVQSIIGPLIATALGTTEANTQSAHSANSAGSNHPAEPLRLTVDRQGGRRYYGEWLTQIIPGSPLRAIEETAVRSSYKCGDARIDFLVEADKLHLETALASMFAKYTRESAMRLFNQWFGSRIPGLRPTAGYPQDAKRFIADITEAGMLPDNSSTLIRTR